MSVPGVEAFAFTCGEMGGFQVLSRGHTSGKGPLRWFIVRRGRV